MGKIGDRRNFDPTTTSILTKAYDKAAAFADSDQKLKDVPAEMIHTSLARYISKTARRGEHNWCRLANGAIAQLRQKTNRDR